MTREPIDRDDRQSGDDDASKQRFHEQLGEEPRPNHDASSSGASEKPTDSSDETLADTHVPHESDQR